MKDKCIIFDFDGTIADTSPGIFNSIRCASDKLNLRTLSDEELKLHLGPPMHKAYNKSFGISGLKLEEAITFHKEYALSTGYREFIFYPGILNVLGKLKECGYGMGIATTKSDVVIKKICQENNLDRFFETINGAVEQESKTDIVKRCLDLLPESDNVYMVGDSVFDMDAATVLGMEFIGVTYGYGFTREDKNKLIKVADSPKEILEHLSS